MFADIAGFILGSIFGAWLISLVAEGVRTGRIPHTDSRSTYSLKGQPIRFILVAVFFSALSATMFYLAFERAAAVWGSLIK